MPEALERQEGSDTPTLSRGTARRAPLPEQTVSEARKAIAKFGEEAVRRRGGLSSTGFLRGLSGLPVNYGTRLQFEAALTGLPHT